MAATLDEKRLKIALQRYRGYITIPNSGTFTTCFGKKLSALPDLYYRSVRPWSGRVAANWGQLMLSTLSDRNGGRFNPPGSFPILYTSGDAHTALEEATRAMEKNGFDPRKAFPRTTHIIQVKLTKVINLYDSEVLRELGLAKQQLRIQNWQEEQLAGRQPITQTIGLLIRQETDAEAIVVPTATKTRKFNLDIFLTREMMRRNLLNVVDPGIPK